MVTNYGSMLRRKVFIEPNDINVLIRCTCTPQMSLLNLHPKA